MEMPNCLFGRDLQEHSERGNGLRYVSGASAAFQTGGQVLESSLLTLVITRCFYL